MSILHTFFVGASAFSSGIITSGLLMNLDANSGISGSSWTDSTGNGYNATLYGSPATTTYNGYNVLSLNGTSQYLGPTGGFSTLLNSASGFTFDVWFYPTTTNNGTLLSEWATGTFDSGWRDAQMAVVASKINTGLYSGLVVTGPTISVNTWYNCAMVYNGSNLLTTYINASSVGTSAGTKSNPTPGTFISLGLPDSAGAYLGGATGFFNGYIGSWKVYRTALNSTQVSQNFQALRTRYGI